MQVCPQVVTLNKPGTSARVPVKGFNLSAKIVTIQTKATLCELQEETVLRSADLAKSSGNGKMVNVQQQNASVSEKKSSFDIDLSESALNAEQKEVAHNFLSQWQPIFSQGPTDLGHTDLVQHTINLEDDKPFKEPFCS